ncbi:MAG: alpha-1,2-fucosyltransferase [SAR324 cluster bacterium]|nr:alpha-1,2-fucosyltransferase [SAR324 cluster bacterium]
MQKTIIISKKTGRLGNRLQLYAHWLAFALEKDLRLLNPAFAEYSLFFQGTADQRWGKFPKDQDTVSPSETSREWIYWSNRAAYKLAKPLAISKNAGIRVAKAQSSKLIQTDSLWNDFIQESWNILFTQGLHFYSPGEWFVRHGDTIRSFLAPLNCYQEKATQFVTQIKLHTDLLVGVHLRQTDYQEFVGGRFFYSLNQYLMKMLEIRKLYHPRSCTFLICSDVSWQGSLKQDLQCFSGPGTVIGDLIALSKCDLILGPPSTFSGWAAWYGKVPIHFLENPTISLALDSFEILPYPHGAFREEYASLG